MQELPFLEINKEYLIPHPGNTFTLSLDSSKLEKDFVFPTMDFEYSSKKLEQAFIILVDTGNQLLKVGSLCTLIETIYTEEEYVLIFESNFKVTDLVINKNNTVSFRVLNNSISQKHIPSLASLATFLYSLKIFNFISSNIDKDSFLENPFVLDQIYAYLTPSIDDDIKFYITNQTTTKLYLIYNHLIETYSIFEPLSKDDKIKDSQITFPEYVNQKYKKEKNRLENIPPTSAEYSSVLDYIELLENIPWDIFSNISIDTQQISESLNKNHYGLQDIKDSILDYFYLQQLTSVIAGSVFLFEGPPGVGKTSIAKAIAKATQRDFIHISLGGVSDESEIRGHRRTYVGSKPGRIVYALSQCKTMNPVILLDEIDKISNYKADPHAALLELLDPEQNDKYIDRYLEIPLDLSKCIFICTSNNSKNLPPALIDRMQIIYFRDYTKKEKEEILLNYIFPNAISSYKLDSYSLSLSEDTIEYLLDKNLREIKSNLLLLLRRKAKEILSGQYDKNISYLSLQNMYSNNNKAKKGIGFATNFNPRKQTHTLS